MPLLSALCLKHLIFFWFHVIYHIQVSIVEVYGNPAGSPWCLVRTLLEDGSEGEEGVIPSVILNVIPQAHQRQGGFLKRTYSSKLSFTRPPSEGQSDNLLCHFYNWYVIREQFINLRAMPFHLTLGNPSGKSQKCIMGYIFSVLWQHGIWYKPPGGFWLFIEVVLSELYLNWQCKIISSLQSITMH